MPIDPQLVRWTINREESFATCLIGQKGSQYKLHLTRESLTAFNTSKEPVHQIFFESDDDKALIAEIRLALADSKIKILAGKQDIPYPRGFIKLDINTMLRQPAAQTQKPPSTVQQSEPTAMLSTSEKGSKVEPAKLSPKPTDASPAAKAATRKDLHTRVRALPTLEEEDENDLSPELTDASLTAKAVSPTTTSATGYHETPLKHIYTDESQNLVVLVPNDANKIFFEEVEESLKNCIGELAKAKDIIKQFTKKSEEQATKSRFTLAGVEKQLTQAFNFHNFLKRHRKEINLKVPDSHTGAQSFPLVLNFADELISDSPILKDLKTGASKAENIKIEPLGSSAPFSLLFLRKYIHYNLENCFSLEDLVDSRENQLLTSFKEQSINQNYLMLLMSNFPDNIDSVIRTITLLFQGKKITAAQCQTMFTHTDGDGNDVKALIEKMKDAQQREAASIAFNQLIRQLPAVNRISLLPIKTKQQGPRSKNTMEEKPKTSKQKGEQDSNCCNCASLISTFTDLWKKVTGESDKTETPKAKMQ